MNDEIFNYYRCEICEKSFKTLCQLNNHVRLKHGQKLAAKEDRSRFENIYNAVIVKTN